MTESRLCESCKAALQQWDQTETYEYLHMVKLIGVDQTCEVCYSVIDRHPELISTSGHTLPGRDIRLLYKKRRSSNPDEGLMQITAWLWGKRKDKLRPHLLSSGPFPSFWLKTEAHGQETPSDSTLKSPDNGN